MGQDFLLLAKGLAAGFFYAFLSVSGIILVAHALLERKTKGGVFAILGIVSVEILWALLASLILYGISLTVNMDSPVVSFIGSFLLFLMAIRAYRQPSRLHLKISVPENLLAFLRIGAKQNILLPLKIIGYGAIFAALKIDKATLTLWEAFLPVFGVIIGALLFWALFSTTLLRKGTMIAPKTLQTFHRSAALILILFSLIGLWELFLRR